MGPVSRTGIRPVARQPRLLAILIIFGGLATAAFAGAHGTKSHAPAAKPSAEERAAFKLAEPVFSQHCYRCHTSAGKKANRKTLQHLDMGRYPFGGHHAHEAASAIRKTLGVTGEKPTMPKDDPGAVSGDALAKVVAWADAFDRARGGTPKQPSDGHDHGHEQAK